MGKTKRPTGLTITRNVSAYTFAWKIGTVDYDAGQKLEYRTQGANGWRDWIKVDVGNTDTSKTVNIYKSNYYPYPSKTERLTAIEFRVKGRRKQYTTGSGNKQKTHTPEWSNWENKTFTISNPVAPTVVGDLGDEWNTSKFTFTITSNDNDDKIFSYYEWQSMRVIESTENDGSKLDWNASHHTTFESGTGRDIALTKTFTEQSEILAQGSRTRWFRVRAIGPSGESAWRYAKHVFAVPFKPVIKGYKVTEKSTNYLAELTWNAISNYAHPIDQTVVEYAVGVPIANMQPPASPSWQVIDTLKDAKNRDDKSVFFTSGKLQNDECLYARVTAQHDTRENQSDIATLLTKNLADPTGLSVVIEDNIATVTATNNSDASVYTGTDASIKRLFLLVMYKDNQKYTQPVNIGIIPYGESSAEITIPSNSSSSGEVTAYINSAGHLIYDDGQILDLNLTEGRLIASEATEVSYEIGVRAIVGTFTYEVTADGSRRYKIQSSMQSASTLWYGGTLPVAPIGVRADYDGKLTLYWTWTWSEADSVELSWSQNEHAWGSTDEPETFVINRQVDRWVVDDITAGSTYYIRVRLFNSETNVYTQYSEPIAVDLTLPPETPILTLSDAVITEHGKVTLSWNYVSRDGTEQSYAEIVCNGQVIAHTTNAKYITLYAEQMNWTGGNEYPMKLRVKSESGSFSDFSDEVSVSVAVPLVAVLENTSLENVNVEDSDGNIRTALSLTEMPMTVEVSGAGAGGITEIAIERAEAYRMARPNERVFDGYEGETVYLYTQVGEDAVEIKVDDLIGAIDDGAKYRMVATIRDGLGQSDSISQEFEVHWNHQAIMPLGEVTMDGLVAKVKPIAPTGALATDVCDIYRLSTDRPELIYPNCAFGSTIVDPYPAINGGYRFVFKTANGDYITEDNRTAWLDLDSEFEYDKAIIEFGTDRVEFYYNVDVSHSWTKDFKRTEYLGGSVQGDWNPSVTRDGNITALHLKPLEEDLAEGLRRLADYSGICNVRTLDGSSFHANVDVNEDNPHDRYGLISEYSLSISRVDAQDYDGVSLETWED